MRWRKSLEMPINRVVVNASPIICLFKSGLADLLPALFREVNVPEEVHQEILAKGKGDLAARGLPSADWLKRVGGISIPPQVASWDLGAGESAVISLALRDPEYWAIIDDREARRCALSLQCRYTGTVGVIVLAKKRELIPSIRESLEKLITAGLWLSSDFRDQVCRRFGE
jgi:predicted nucleic acid-binding protein